MQTVLHSFTVLQTVFLVHGFFGGGVGALLGFGEYEVRHGCCELGGGGGGGGTG